MPKPTNSELILDLIKEVAVLTERLDATRDELKDFKRQLEEDSKKRWALLPPIAGALVNVFLSAVVAYIVSRLAVAQ